MSSDRVVSGIIQADVLQQYLDVYTSLVDEGRWHFGDKGITGAVVDPANVAMYDDTQLARTAFESFDAPGQVTIGMNFNKLDEYLGSAKSDDLVELGVNMETRHLEIKYRKIHHEMALIDPDSIRAEPDRPELELSNHVVVDGDDLEEAAKNVDLTSDHINFAAESDGQEFVLYAKGDTDRTDIRFDVEELKRADIGEPDAESLFSLNYLKDMLKPIPSDTEVTIHFGDEFPMRMVWDAFDEQITVESMLAPRIQSN